MPTSWDTDSDALFERGCWDTQSVYLLCHTKDMGIKAPIAPVTQVPVASSSLCCFPYTGPICQGTLAHGCHGS